MMALLAGHLCHNCMTVFIGKNSSFKHNFPIPEVYKPSLTISFDVCCLPLRYDVNSVDGSGVKSMQIQIIWFGKCYYLVFCWFDLSFLGGLACYPVLVLQVQPWFNTGHTN